MESNLSEHHWKALQTLREIDKIDDLSKIASENTHAAIIDTDPTLGLIIAEYCLKHEQWLAAAQIFLRFFIQGPIEKLKKESLLLKLNEVLHLTNNTATDLASTTDYFLYCYRQLNMALSKESIHGKQKEQWISEATQTLLNNEEDQQKAKSIYHLISQNSPSAEFRRENSGYQAFIIRYFKQQENTPPCKSGF